MNDIVICGIGLIGGSIAKGLSKDNFNVYAIDSNLDSKNNAIRNKDAHEAMHSVEEVNKLDYPQELRTDIRRLVMDTQKIILGVCQGNFIKRLNHI